MFKDKTAAIHKTEMWGKLLRSIAYNIEPILGNIWHEQKIRNKIGNFNKRKSNVIVRRQSIECEKGHDRKHFNDVECKLYSFNVKWMVLRRC